MKDFISTCFEIKELDDKGTVTFIANAFGNIDSDNDISNPGSFKKTISENAKRIRHFKYHNSQLMPGVIQELKETDIGLEVTSQLILGTQLGRETYEEYKAMFAAGKQMEHSIGVNAIKFEIKDDIRTVSEWKLWEVSTLTAWGSNDKALALSLKDIETASREEIEKELIFLKGLLNVSFYSDLKLEQIEKQYNFINTLKAGMESEQKATTSQATLQEFKRLMNL